MLQLCTKSVGNFKYFFYILIQKLILFFADRNLCTTVSRQHTRIQYLQYVYNR